MHTKIPKAAELKPFSSNLDDYDKIKFLFDLQAIAYNPAARHRINGDFIFRFPEHTFILRTETNLAKLLIDEKTKEILLDISFKDAKTCLKYIAKEKGFFSIFFHNNIRINSKINLGFFRHAAYYISCFVRPNKKYHQKRNTDGKESIDNILILQASPRSKSGYTEIYLNYLLKGIKKQDISIEIIYVYEKDIDFCNACFSCKFETNGRCSAKDDSNYILGKIKEADLILLAFPILTGGLPGKLKSVIDKWFALGDIYRSISKNKKIVIYNKRKAHKKQYILGLSISGHPDKKQFLPTTKYLELLSETTSATFLGNIAIPDAVNLDNSPREEKYKLKVKEYLEAMGEDLIKTNKIHDTKINRILNRKINTPDWAYWANVFTDYILT